MTYPGEKPHAFVRVEPGVKYPEFCAHCGDERSHPIHDRAHRVKHTQPRRNDGRGQ